MKTICLCLLTSALLIGCATQKEPQQTMAQFGICYDARNCPAGQETAFSVQENACNASGGKSWKGQSGCINF